MSRDQIAQLLLASYAAIAVAVVAVQMFRSRAGVAAWLLYVCDRLYVGLMFQWRADGRCPFPAEGPGLVIANHRSPIDPMLVWTNHHWGTGGVVRVIGFLMAREYYESPGVNLICRIMRAIPLSRDGRDVGPVREALRRLRAGELVGVFPEGRINREEGLLEGDTGLAWLALKSQVPVYPVFIHGVPQSDSMIAPFFRPCRVRLSYGKPVDLSRYYGRRPSQQVLREVTDMLMEQLAMLGGVSYSASKVGTKEAATVAVPSAERSAGGSGRSSAGGDA